MGYHTDFHGQFKVTPTLTDEHKTYLKMFAETRRMKRNEEKAEEFLDPVRNMVALPIGIDGAFFVGGGGFAGQDHDDSIIDYNKPPGSQPGLWCHWEPTEDGQYIEWNGSEKFYEYIEWLNYIIENFLQPWGYKLNGEVEWFGEDREDMGKIIVSDNEIGVLQGRIVYEDPDEAFDQAQGGSLLP